MHKDLVSFSERGLKTIVMAMREIILDENVVKNGWDKLMIEDVESDLTLLGAVGIRDVL
jgi:magnesium-transporting ATPase (P-type)